MDNHKTIIYISCEHMKLRVPENKLPRYKAYLWEINTPGENTLEEIAELKKELLNFNKNFFEQDVYAPWCSKLDQLCLTVESVAINNGYAPLQFILANSQRILKCKQAELSKASFLEDFVLERIDVNHTSI